MPHYNFWSLGFKYLAVSSLVYSMCSCSSSSDTEPPTGNPNNNSALNGNYYVAGQQLDPTATTTEVWSWTGIMSFDGNGNCSYTGSNEVGAKRINETTAASTQVFIGSPDSGNCTYELAMDNTLTLDGSTHNYVSSDFNTIVGIRAINAIETLIKLGNGSFDNSSLNGDYWLSSQTNMFTTTTTEDNGILASVTFNGDGTCTYTETSNITEKRTENVSPRTIEPIQNTLTNTACSYNLAADGTLTINGKTTFGVSADTNTIIGIDYIDSTGIASASYVALYKKSSSLDNSSIQGKYADLWLLFELYPDTTEAWTWGGVTSFDGNGNCTYQGNYLQGISRDESVDPRILNPLTVTPVTANCTYNLAADGTLTLVNTGENETYTYYVNPNTHSIVGLQDQVRNSFVSTFFTRLVRLPN